MKYIFLALILLFSASPIAAQVTFTHTTDTDFNKGIAENVLIKNNSVSLPFKKGSINDWTSTTNLPQNLIGHRMATWRNFVYLSGGYNGSAYNNYVYRATVNTTGISGWTQLGNLPENVAFHAMVATGTKLYILGGKTTGDPSNKIYAATINDDGSLGSWSLQTITLPLPLWGHTATLVNGFLYIAGGGQLAQTNSAQSGVWYSAINALDELIPFQAATSLPEARNGHSMVTYDGKIFILGGYNSSGSKKATVYQTILNPNGSCGSWFPQTPLPTPVSNHVSTCSNGMITVIGGEESTILSNKFYYADVDNPMLTWELSDKYLYDRAKNSAAVSADNQIIYAGGSIPTGALVSTIRYVQLIPSTTMVKKGIYLSAPFVVGSPKNIQKLTYNLIMQSGDSFELLYRLAGVNKTWGNWVSAGSANPAMINQENSYIQYMFLFVANSVNDITLNDVTLTVSGYTQLSGNLNSVSSLTASASPYWATGNITFTAGSHIIQPGVTIVFSPNTGLEIGQASVSFNGNQAQPIRLTSFDSTDGQWNGVYFNDASDAGVSSQMNYTTIERAGYGSWDANLYCYSTNQPVVNNCTFRKAMGHGVRMESSNFILNNTTISHNETNGLYLNASNPILNNVVTRNNGNAGIYYASGGLNPSYSMTRSENNTYGLFSPTPDVSFIPESATTLLFQNNGSDIAVNGGNIHSSRVWKYFPNGYTILGNITIYQNSGNPTLTIGPGTRVKFVSASGLYIGAGGNQGGQLYAVGTADSLITFTAANGQTGGWTGLYFNDGSDYNSTSSLRYCVVEKGNEYNVFSVNSIEPHIMFTTIRHSVTYGIKLQNASINIEETTIKKALHGLYLDNSAPSLILTTFDSITTYCVLRANDGANPNFSQCIMKNSMYGIYYPHPNYTVPTYSTISFINLKASIAMNGGDISTDQTWNKNTFGYAILGNLRVIKYQSISRLTIRPGCILKFSKNTGLQIGFQGYYSNEWYPGEMDAQGTTIEKILFTSLNDSVGGWNGIYFHDHSDRLAGMVSVLTHCIIENGNQYNVWVNNSSQPTIENCTISKAFNMGLHLEAAPIIILNSDILQNGGIGINAINSLLTISNIDILNNSNYGLFYNNAHYVHNLTNLNFSGNSKDGVIIGGGDVSENRTWKYFGASPYYILGNIRIIKYQSPCRLTINPGCTIKVDKNVNIQIGYQGYYSNEWYPGELYAVGKSDSLITFTATNDSAGGWNGIYFHDYSDRVAGMVSFLKYCKISKASQYNIWCNNTTQPLIENCIIERGTGYGLWLDAANVTVKNSVIRDHLGYGLYLTAGSNPVIGNNFVNACDIFNNSYNIYNNTGNNINMRYNFLGSCDSSYIAGKVWDKSDNSGLGRITFTPFSWLPVAQQNAINVSGKFYYDNSPSKPLRNAVLTLKDQSNNNTVATAQTNSSGSFSFAPLTLNVPTSIQFTLNDQFGGVNATDAQRVMQHFTYTTPPPRLDANHTFVADVNKSSTVNGTDAMMILQRFANVITSFPTGNLQIDCDSVILTNPGFTYNLSALWFGDVNGSYSTLSKSPGIGMVYEGAIYPGSWQEFTMRVKIKTKVELGAISHTFLYPPEFLEVLGVTLMRTGTPLIFTAQEGILRTGWYSLDPIQLTEEEVFLLIRFKTKDLSTQTLPISIALGDENELTDGFASPHQGVILSVPVIPVTITGLGREGNGKEEQFAFRFFPNPAREFVTFSWTMPKTGLAKIVVSDAYGREVALVPEQTFKTGENQQILSLPGISAGVYFIRFFIEGEQNARLTRKLIVQ